MTAGKYSLTPLLTATDGRSVSQSGRVCLLYLPLAWYSQSLPSPAMFTPQCLQILAAFLNLCCFLFIMGRNTTESCDSLDSSHKTLSVCQLSRRTGADTNQRVSTSFSQPAELTSWQHINHVGWVGLTGSGGYNVPVCRGKGLLAR